MSGWIKLHRKIVDWEWYGDLPTTFLFIHLLLSANHTEKTWRGITIKKGQFITSIESLKVGTKLTNQNVRTALKKLEIGGEILIKTTNKFSLITIVNYDTYQCEDCNTNKQLTNKLTNEQQTTNKQTNKRLTTTKNDKEIKNDKERYVIDTPVIETEVQLPPTKQEVFALQIEEKLIYFPGTRHIGGFTENQRKKLADKYREQFGETSEKTLEAAIQGYDSWYGNLKQDKKYKPRDQDTHYRSLLYGGAFLRALSYNTSLINNMAAKERFAR